ncbi:MAG: hypothetical protein EXX96DRAFT_565244 [Benjaminiella poitrasii]|nr:MAG: hypothetical protein EXX96DRAFT_565244 [Benjaminiella poitrasii]
MSRILKQPSITVRTPKHRSSPSKLNDESTSQTGQRVTIPSLDNATGVLRYVGETDFRPGLWAGVELDKKGQGKNDGSVQGIQYFTCPPNSGIFINFNKIIIHPPITPEKPLTPRRSNLPTTTQRRSSSSLMKSSSSSSSSSTNTTTTTTSTIRRSKMVARTSSIPKLPPSVKPPPSLPTTPTGTPANRTTLTPILKRTTPAPPISSPTPPPQRTLTPTTTTQPSALQQQQQRTMTPTQSVQQQQPTPPSPLTVSHQQDETTMNQLYEMLERTQRERDKLLSEMKSKETAWERLVSSKESLTVQVEEGEQQCHRLTRQVDEQQQEIERLEETLAARDASIAKNQRDEAQQGQDQRRIERLEQLLRDLQAQIRTLHEERDETDRVHAGVLEQVRREVAASEANTASLEKECEELKRAGLEAIRAYELQVVHLKDAHRLDLEQRDRMIQQLEYTVADLKHKQSTLFDDEQDVRLENMMPVSDKKQLPVDQRHRLEEQLELATNELDHERQAIQALMGEIEQLKSDLKQAHQQALSFEDRFEALQSELEKELNDKKRLIEEAEHAFEAQAKAEDEHYQIKLSKMALEKDHNELLESHKQLEQDYNSLLDDMLLLEKQDLKKTGGHLASASDSDDPVVLQKRIHVLEQENESQRLDLASSKRQIEQLTKDLNELESLVESRVFGEADLEEQLEIEKRKVKTLEKELNALKNRVSHTSSHKGLLISPTTTTTTTSSSSPIPSPQFNRKKEPAYCELCEEPGHDILQCKADLTKVVTTDAKKEKDLFCDNCDRYGDHTTEHCPKQDETF